jgi:hypothetical protein
MAALFQAIAVRTGAHTFIARLRNLAPENQHFGIEDM